MVSSQQPRKATVSEQWATLPAPRQDDLPRMKRDYQALALSNSLDPKRFMKGATKLAKVPDLFAVSNSLQMTRSYHRHQSRPQSDPRGGIRTQLIWRSRSAMSSSSLDICKIPPLPEIHVTSLARLSKAWYGTKGQVRMPSGSMVICRRAVWIMGEDEGGRSEPSGDLTIHVQHLVHPAAMQRCGRGRCYA